MSEQLLQLIDRAICAESDPKIPSAHDLGIMRGIAHLLNSAANELPTEVGNKILAYLLRLGGHVWWNSKQTVYKTLFTDVMDSEMQSGTYPDEAARNVVERVCSGIIEDKKGVLDLRDLMQIIGCCVGVDEICEEIAASG